MMLMKDIYSLARHANSKILVEDRRRAFPDRDNDTFVVLIDGIRRRRDH